MIYETAEVCHLGELRCRVQVRRCLDGSFQQRHVWLTDHLGNGLLEPAYDPWIASFTRRPDLALRGMVPAPHEPDETDILLNALRLIAAGHNDARSLAAEALRKVGL